MITASQTKTPYFVTITNGDTSVYSDVAKERGGKEKAFRPHEFLCAAYASCFHITLCKLLDKEKLSYEQVIVSVDLDRSVEGQTKFLYQCEIIGAIENAKKEELMKKASRCPIGLSLEQTILFEPFN